LGAGFVGNCYQSQVTLNIPDAYEDPRFDKSVDKKTGYRTRAVLCAPIVASHQVVAVIQAMNKESDSEFNSRDEILLRILGQAAASHLRSCESKSSQQVQLLRKDAVIEACHDLASMKGTGALPLLKTLHKTYGKLFRAKRMAMTVVQNTRLVRLVTDDEFRSLTTQDFAKACGLVGAVVSERRSVICFSPESDSRYNSLIDLPAAREMSYTFPILDGSSLRAVVQWTSSERPAKGSREASDSLAYNELNSKHREVLDQLHEFVAIYLRRIFPNESIAAKITTTMNKLRAIGAMRKAQQAMEAGADPGASTGSALGGSALGALVSKVAAANKKQQEEPAQEDAPKPE